MLITIAVDAMSGDKGHTVASAAIKAAVAADTNLQVIAVGQPAVLEPLLAGSERISIHAAEDVIMMTDKPLQSLRRRKSSMFQAIELVKEGKAAAALSAGNTGALMGMARIQLKMIAGYSRPAIASFIPCNKCNDTFCMLDLGANVDRNVDMLRDLAYMGVSLARVVHGIEQPRVGLLNIGEEYLKGGTELIKATEILAASELNFVGNVEANHLYDCVADVVVCDGFTGNVFLKTMEGLSGMIRGMLVDAYTSSLYNKFAGLISKPLLNDLRKTMDARRYNGAAFLGVRGLVVKSHGNADEVAFGAALEFTVKQARQDLVKLITATAPV